MYVLLLIKKIFHQNSGKGREGGTTLIEGESVQN